MGLLNEIAVRDEQHYLATVGEVRALAEQIGNLGDAKAFADRARALEIWAQRQRLGTEKINLAVAAQLWAKRREGELLREMREKGERAKHGRHSESRKSTLTDLGVTGKESSQAQALADIPADDFAAIIEKAVPEGRITQTEILRRHKRAEREKQAAEAEAALVADVAAIGGPTWRIEHADLREFNPGPVDAIVTDPPYITDDAIDLYKALGEFAARVLKPGGALFALCSQPYLPSVFEALEHPELVYRWTVAWISGAHESTADQRRVFDRWKPVVVYHRGAWPEKVPMLTDVVNSGRDEQKKLHPWQQDLTGTRQLVRAASRPGDLVCDPFVGSGTTCLAALAEDRHFVGCDIDAKAVAIAEKRLAA